MPNLLAVVTDSYARRARLMPALLVVLPIGFALAAWFPAERAAWGVLVGLAATCGLGVLLAEVGRDQGKKCEQELFARWGGTPTTRMLRHADATLNPVTRARYMERLRALVPHIRLPSAEEERADPRAADRVYESCVHYLREHTRAREQFPLVFAENVSYGFRRNLWAMRAAGTTLSAVGLAASGVRVAAEWLSTGAAGPLALAAVVINALLMALWLLRFTREWVRIPAEAYAERLLAACDKL